MSSSSRRKFIQQLGTTGLALTAGSFNILHANNGIKEEILTRPDRISANDRIRVALIGAGIMGNNDLETALKTQGIEFVAACDLYQGRLTRINEKYGAGIFTTRDYREILAKKDIDAVIIGTADLWHSRISIDAMNAGKHVYCEKPMVKEIAQGLPVIETAMKTNRVIQIGSQGISGLVHQKAKELYHAGEIGKLNSIEASIDRHSAMGAWQYTLPNDASPQTVDWDRYIAGMPKQPFDALKFFRWRNYREFGTGAAGDMFVHLLTEIHFITGSKGPSRIFCSGQLSMWKDGRNVPDVMNALMEYPESPEHGPFQVNLRLNFASGVGDGYRLRFIGDEGAMEIGDGLTITHDLIPKAPGIGNYDALSTYPQAMQDALVKAYDQKYTAADRITPKKDPIRYKAPEGHDDHVEHFKNFFEAVRTGGKVVEDAVFGFRAAAPCLACNESYFQKKLMHWDPVGMKLK
ncbi:Gfo/Idh/MocA family oxidoreductase [Flavihumibacter fluvii]|uniref:Gfo/Idh/MocA family oxidoreductase n=1 Tax=Flavihumibacter fluvii TaxID=2838157 RepID=UPI001BDEA474|nr:Gfo/Idh/MocA family oxidoreductase [Flavihumibacter fluvii]ULQ52975.1 Gfo/Idh/MocA family oxidoreductase [Flavihumibacter fluvii]